MIAHPFLITLILLSIVFLVLFLSENERTKSFFKYLPVPLWCYFIPTLLSTCGILSSDLPFYSSASRFLLPACLFLLLIPTHLPSIFRLSAKALAAMAIGTLGILAGGMATFLIFVKFGNLPGALPIEELSKGWGSLGATWTGGSMNMISVKEILGTQDAFFPNLIITDTVIAYSWMAILVYFSKQQGWIDSKLGASQDFLIDESRASFRIPSFAEGRGVIFRTFFLLTLSFSFSALSLAASKYFPSYGKVLNGYTWVIILATIAPLACSATKLRNLEAMGASRAGNVLLLFLLTTIGARADLSTLKTAPLFIGLGFLWVAIHGIILLAGGKLFRIPMSLLATASQANVGGTVSAPIVAGIYHKELASLGVILAVLGNIYGTYAGLFLFEICRKIADML